MMLQLAMLHGGVRRYFDGFDSPDFSLRFFTLIFSAFASI